MHPHRVYGKSLQYSKAVGWARVFMWNKLPDKYFSSVWVHAIPEFLFSGQSFVLASSSLSLSFMWLSSYSLLSLPLQFRQHPMIAWCSERWEGGRGRTRPEHWDEGDRGWERTKTARGSISLDKTSTQFHDLRLCLMKRLVKVIGNTSLSSAGLHASPPRLLGAYLSCSSLRALSMFMRWPTLVTPRSIRSSFCSEGRWAPSISLSRKASLCSPRLRLSSQSATSCLLHSSMGLEANGLPEAATACISVSGDGERELPLPPQEELRLYPPPLPMGGVGRPKTSVRVGDTEGGSEEQGVREEAESGGLQGCVWDGRLLGGVEVRAAAPAALLRIPESSVGGLREQRRRQVSQSETHTITSGQFIIKMKFQQRWS